MSYTFNFGKHNGKSIDEVIQKHPYYCYYIYSNCKEEYKTSKFNLALKNAIDKYNMPMPFGKYKDSLTNHLDKDYCSYLLDNTKLKNEDSLLKYKLLERIHT